MFFVGHGVLGVKLASPFLGAQESRIFHLWKYPEEGALPFWPLVLGCVLPDLIDKPIYYGPKWLWGTEVIQSTIITGTRTFGHTALLVFLIFALGWWRESKAAAAVALGMASHLMMDHLFDVLLCYDHFPVNPGEPSYRLEGLLWPFLGNHFPIIKYGTVKEHASTFIFKHHIWIGESLGLLLLIRDYVKFKFR